MKSKDPRIASRLLMGFGGLILIASAAAEQCLGSSKELGMQAETLRNEVKTFLHGVRAA